MNSSGEVVVAAVVVAEVDRLRAAVREARALLEGALEPGAVGRPVREFTRGEMADLESAVRVLTGALAPVPPEVVSTANDPAGVRLLPEGDRCRAVFGAGEDGDPRPAVCGLLRGHDGPHAGGIVEPPACPQDVWPPTGAASARRPVHGGYPAPRSTV